MSDTAIHLHVHTGDRGPDTPPAIRDLTGGDPDAYPKDLDDLHARLIRWFEESELARMDEIDLAQRDRDYVDHNQYTRDELKVLRDRGQPIITINKIKDKLELLCGMERKARTDPKAFARTPAEEDRADAATQCLRYIADDNSFSLLRSLVFENMLTEGAGGVDLGLEDDGQGSCNVTMTHIPWDRVWYDPHSRSLDFGDARYKGLVIWTDRDTLEELYPGEDVQDVIESSFSSADYQYNDRPETAFWTDNNRTRIRLVQCDWSERGTWWRATYTKSGLLAAPQRSKFKDRKGKSCSGLLLQSSYINRENQRYGMVRGLISLQDEINKRRSKAMHLLNVHQVVAEQGAVPDVDKARREVAKPDGYVEVMPGLKFEIQQTTDLAAGQFQLLQHATAEMQLSGPNAAMSGTDPRELSGRAVLAMQAGGAAQNEPLADALRFWSRRVYETAWQAAREFWSGGKWVRVTDDLNETRWVGINRPVRLMDKLADMDPQHRAMIMQQMQLQPGDPRLQQVVGIENDITDLDVDITIEEGIDIPSLQAEEFQSLVQLASVQPGLIPGDVLIAASGLRDKDMILERMKAHQQQQQQAQQQAGQIAAQHGQAQIADLQSKAAANMALAKERTVNAASTIHDAHRTFQGLPDDNATQVNPAQPPPDPEQMTPDLAMAHHVADLQQKHLDLQKTGADISKTRADTLLTAAKIPQAAQQTLHTAHQTHQTAITTNRLMRTPIPQPQPPGSAP
jgi:hypothetical protein